MPNQEDRRVSKILWSLVNFGLPGTFGSRVIHYVRDRQTDGQKQRLMPPTLRAGA